MTQFQEKSVVIVNEHLSDAFFRLVLKAPQIAAQARPGQFVMVTCGITLDPLLRRPLSIHRCSGDGTLHLLIKVVGKGTQLLHALKPGDMVDMLGPLGHGFHADPQGPGCLVGGGVGIAPLLFLAEDLNRQHPDHANLAVFLGGQTGGDIRQLGEEFAHAGCQVFLATDDGSLGEKGLVTALLAPRITQFKKVYVCGPTPMMAACAALCKEAHIACEVSLEASMACGLGACLGCTVYGADGQYRHVCKHGPVLPAEEIAWNR